MNTTNFPDDDGENLDPTIEALEPHDFVEGERGYCAVCGQPQSLAVHTPFEPDQLAHKLPWLMDRVVEGMERAGKASDEIERKTTLAGKP